MEHRQHKVNGLKPNFYKDIGRAREKALDVDAAPNVAIRSHQARSGYGQTGSR
jgi:hypothetical protein